MKISDSGLSLLRSFEGCKLEAYRCPAGIWTIGYGHTGKDVHEGLKITPERALALLRDDLRWFEDGVTRALEGCPANSNQFSAMVCLAYNIGLRAFTNSSVLRRHMAKDVQGAADAFLMWTKGGGKVLPGLVRRREAERGLYLG